MKKVITAIAAMVLVTGANADGWNIEAGHKFNFKTEEQSVVELDTKYFAHTGDENYIAGGYTINKLNNIPFGVSVQLEYINIDKGSHTLAFGGDFVFGQQYLNNKGHFYAGGAFGYGFDQSKGGHFIDRRTNIEYTTDSNPTFIYSRFDLGMKYQFTKNFGVNIGFESACRAYDLSIKAVNVAGSSSIEAITAYQAEASNIDLVTYSATVGINYKF